MASNGVDPAHGNEIDAKDITHLVARLDTIYELHSFLPQNIDNDPCEVYLKSGVCTVKCELHHPLIPRLIDTEVPTDHVLGLIYILERTASLIKIVSPEATQDLATVLKPVCKMLSNHFSFFIAHYSYGDVAYLYDECCLRVLVNVQSFLNNKSSSKQYFKKVYQVKPPTSSLMTVCLSELRGLRENFLANEDLVHDGIVVLLAPAETDTTPTQSNSGASCLASDPANDGVRALLCCIAGEMTSLSDGYSLLSDPPAQLMSTITAALRDLWGSPAHSTNTNDCFTITPCGLRACGIGVSPTCYAITPCDQEQSQGIVMEEEVVVAALARSGLIVVKSHQDDLQQSSGLVVSLPGQEQESAQQVQLLLHDQKEALLSTHLLTVYCDSDHRVRPLLLGVLRWAQARGCCDVDPEIAALSPYGWTLLVLHFLRQHPLFSLPTLEEAGRGMSEGRLISSAQTPREGENQEVGQSVSKTTDAGSADLGAVLLQFFLFYGTCSHKGFRPFHAIACLRNKHKVFKQDISSLPLTQSQSQSPTQSPLHMSAREAVLVLTGSSNALPATSDSDAGGCNLADREKRSKSTRNQDLLPLSCLPCWRFCVVDPLREVDEGAAIHSRVGQAHVMTELRRAVSSFRALVGNNRQEKNYNNNLSDRSSGADNSSNNNGEGASGSEVSGTKEGFWRDLCSILELPTTRLPAAARGCSLCGQVGHTRPSCPHLRCLLCQETGHFMRDCLRNFCSNCCKQGHFARDCALPKTGGHHHPHRRSKSSDKGKGGVAGAEVAFNDHLILPARRHRFDSADMELSSSGVESPHRGESAGKQGSSGRRRRRPHHHPHSHHQQQGKHLSDPADIRKESKPLPTNRQSKPSAPTPNSQGPRKSRIPWTLSTPRPQINTQPPLLKQKFFSGMYSPQSSPYSSPRDFSPAPGKHSHSHRPAHKPSRTNHNSNMGAKLPGHNQSGSGSSRPLSGTPRPTSTHRARSGSISATAGAGYTSGGSTIASPRLGYPPSHSYVKSPLAGTSASSTLLQADSKLDNTAYPKLPSKPQPLSHSLQKKQVAGAPTKKTTDEDGEAGSGLRLFTTPLSRDGTEVAMLDSPELVGAGSKVSVSVLEQQSKRTRFRRKKQSKPTRREAKRPVAQEGRAVKAGDRSRDEEGKMSYAKAAMGPQEKATGRVNVAHEENYFGEYDLAEEKQAGNSPVYADYIDYL